jgi:hypothetical protein
MGSSKVDVQKADLTVDDFVLRKPPTSINRHSFQRATRNRVNTNQRTAVFNGVHHDLESGSGPRARRFKSSLSDQYPDPDLTRNTLDHLRRLWYPALVPRPYAIVVLGT